MRSRKGLGWLIGHGEVALGDQRNLLEPVGTRLLEGPV